MQAYKPMHTLKHAARLLSLPKPEHKLQQQYIPAATPEHRSRCRQTIQSYQDGLGRLHALPSKAYPSTQLLYQLAALDQGLLGLLQVLRQL